jgi:hypothetical protein
MVRLLPKGIFLGVARLAFLVTNVTVLRFGQQIRLLISRFAVFQKQNSCPQQETNGESGKIGAPFSHVAARKLRSFSELSHGPEINEWQSIQDTEIQKADMSPQCVG